jgi:hypothetical protein
MRHPLEDELRQAYRELTDTIREEDLPGLYERPARPRRRRWFSAFTPLAAAAAVLVAIGVGVAVPKLANAPSGPTEPAGPGAPGTVAAPPFMIVLNRPNAPRPLLVVSAVTGRTTAELPVPRTDTVWVDAEATGSGTTFVLAATPNRGGLCDPTYLYTLTLSGGGKVASLRPWTVPVVPAEVVSLSASADGSTLAFVSDECRGPDQEIGIISGRAMRTWRESYPLVFLNGDLSLSGDGSKLVYADAPAGGQDARVRVLDTSSAPGSASAASKTLYTLPAAGRASSFAIGADFTTMYVSWLTGRDSFHLVGYRIGPGGVQRTLFSRTMSGQFISWAGRQLMVWNPGVSLSLVDPVTGKATRIRTAWVNAWGITW